ncbi:tRNA lysidine(34) synthetase TilS [Shewanella japonica]|uniref:tRNA lysidine(34) synthetase TilS n=1 Tax=Shewanella japonica TaxID=93973 RepID=UPI000E73CC79|nr:tRNA lysidine(34) synthetase TilS [Shewanella japonica]
MKIINICEAIKQHTSALLPINSPAGAVNAAHHSPNKIVLAYSGGVDSECLCYGLSQFAQQNPHISCLLVHVHHGLSPNADEWAQHCVSQASHYQLPIQVEHVSLTKTSRTSLEAIARDARYQVFKKYLNPGDILLTAHHQDDQLETLLLALKRGQGPKGLAAMGSIQAFHQQSWVIRPLLGFSRSDIEAFAIDKSLIHIEDESNLDTQYDRNFLRQDIIPRLKQRWPSIAATASRSAQLCAQQQSIVDAEVTQRLPEFITYSPSFSLSGPGLALLTFKEQSSEWQNLLLRGFILAQGYKLPSQSQLEQIVSQLLYAANDANVDVQCAGYSIKRFAGCAYVVPKISKKDLEASQSIDAELLTNAIQRLDMRTEEVCTVKLSSLSINNLEGEQSPQPLHVSVGASTQGARLSITDLTSVSIAFTAKGSTRCQPHFRDKGRVLKKIWQELAVPPWMRDRVALVFYGEVLVAAIGLWVDKRYLAKADEIGLLLNYKMQASD